MPTFVFIKNKTTVDSIRGADPSKLESSILKWMGSSSELEPNPERIALGRSFPCFKDLQANDPIVSDTASNILIRYANNIMKDPNNLKYRQIKLENAVFMEKLLPALGAVDCLFVMGFQEMNDRLLLPPESSLDNLHALRDALVDIKSLKTENLSQEKKATTELTQACTTSKPSGIFRKRTLKYQAKMTTSQQVQFFSSLRSGVNQALLYEEEELQEKARSKMPVDRLLKQAEENSRLTSDKDGNASVSKNDCLLVLLLAWFKNEFFTWMNSPKCSHCNIDTNNKGTDNPTEDEKQWGAGTVEIYQCPQCLASVRFPRYNHPQKLLETRTGRCGEWANCFTLCCRAVGLEARYVLDWTDHVWTEVYSTEQKRWLHCDACENICDKPLVYESGWNKKLSYVIAFSKDQVFDVTWRYSNKHQEVQKRRKNISEKWLFDVCQKITEELQYDVSDERKQILIERVTVEVVEFITPKKVLTKEEQEGRLSGNLAWRKLRGEISDNPVEKMTSSFSFKPSEENIQKKRFRVRYYPTLDFYSTSLDDQYSGGSNGCNNDINGWQNGVSESKSMLRKKEHDWKMVYLARTEGSEKGVISWHLDFSETNVNIDTVQVKFRSKTYENGDVVATLCGDDICKRITEEDSEVSTSTDFYSKAFSGSKSLELTAILKGGRGDVSWQHAQLFRCDESMIDFTGFDIDITLKNDV